MKILNFVIILFVIFHCCLGNYQLKCQNHGVCYQKFLSYVSNGQCYTFYDLPDDEKDDIKMPGVAAFIPANKNYGNVFFIKKTEKEHTEMHYLKRALFDEVLRTYRKNQKYKNKNLQIIQNENISILKKPKMKRQSTIEKNKPQKKGDDTMTIKRAKSLLEPSKLSLKNEAKQSQGEIFYSNGKNQRFNNELFPYNLFQKVTGVFYIYVKASPCLKCLENYYTLLYYFPKITFNIFFELYYDKIDFSYYKKSISNYSIFRECRYDYDKVKCVINRYYNIIDGVIKIPNLHFERIVNKPPCQEIVFAFKDIFIN